MTSSYSPILRLPGNNKGRDFVVGDIHGQYLRLLLLLEGTQFNPQNGDRLISVGDLVDRGPHSLETLALLQQPWFHAAVGNHELFACQVIREMLRDPASGTQMAKSNDENIGCRWIADRWSERTLGEWRNTLRDLLDLPSVIVVGEGASRFHVTHSALTFNNTLISDSELDNPSPELLLYLSSEDFTWDRNLPNPRMAIHSSSSGPLSVTYCGHNWVNGPTLRRNHLMIDTGASLLGYPPDDDESTFAPSLTMIRHTLPADLSSTAVSYFSVGRMLVFEPTLDYAQRIGVPLPDVHDSDYRRYSLAPPSPVTPVRQVSVEISSSTLRRRTGTSART